MKLQVKDKATGKVHPVFKYIACSDGTESIWCVDWYGHHRIGFDCEWATAENSRMQPVIEAAEKVAKLFAHKGDHQTCAICQLARALEQWKDGKEVEDDSK